MDRKSTVIWATKLALSAGLAAWFLHRSQTPMILNAIQRLPPVLSFSLLTAFLASFWLNALKWKQFTPQTPLGDLFRLTLIGHYYSTLTPGQVAGEAVKIFRLGRMQAGTSKAARSVVLDRISGLTAIFSVGFMGAWFSRSEIPGPYIPWFAAVLAAIGAGFWLFQWRIYGGERGHSGNLRRSRARFQPRNFPAESTAYGTRNPTDYTVFSDYKRLALFFGQGTEHRVKRRTGDRELAEPVNDGKPIVRRNGFLRALALGIVLQLLCVGIVSVFGRQMGVRLAFADWCWIFGAISLVVFIPATIAGIGLREAGFVSLMGLYEVPMETALALSMVVLGLQLSAVLAGAVIELTSRRSPVNGGRAPFGFPFD